MKFSLNSPHTIFEHVKQELHCVSRPCVSKINFQFTYSGVSIPYICYGGGQKINISRTSFTRIKVKITNFNGKRDTGWTSKIMDDVFYERLAKHTVKIVDAES